MDNSVMSHFQVAMLATSVLFGSNKYSKERSARFRRIKPKHFPISSSFRQLAATFVLVSADFLFSDMDVCYSF